ncbi:MAG: phosphatase PAP2 family protein [Candidatus Poseidoniaceae archaeon]|jgi:membrane-associated phospholipid phosphatase|nr:phosphatase PAP2 family protein [Candidatus Poseidoniaceae archaeon]
MDGIYLTWLISALAIGVLLMPIVKPPWSKITLEGFIDFLRRYWMHILLVLTIYNAKDFLDEVDRILMANTGLDMTPWIYAVEGDMVLWVQEAFLSDWLTTFMTHFYVVGFMVICYVSIFYFAYFDDRWMADRICFTIFWVYALAVPFYLFFNVRVAGDHIPGMETLAYDLTGEINDWFTRIDPFTNGMPSLHIGFPFAVWLCLLRNDVDGRWKVYRRIVFAYTLVTAFCIVYLGIHWFLDIIGGMVIAAIAVSITDRMAGPFWKIFDERTVNARLATVLTNPGRAFSIIKGSIINTAKRYSKPTSSETGSIIVAVMILISGVITWDLTHQSLPANGVSAPIEVSSADGWLVTLDDRGESALLVVHDLSDLSTEIEVAQPIMTLNSSYDIRGDLIVMTNTTKLIVSDLAQNGIEIFSVNISGNGSVTFVANDVIALNDDNGLQYISLKSEQVIGPSIPEDEDLLLFTSNNEEIALVLTSESTVVHLGLMGSEGMISIKINATGEESEDQILIDNGRNVDVENSTITDVVLSETHIAAIVDVNATKRLVLVNRSNGDSIVISDAKFAAQDPYLSNEILMWAQYQNIDPTNASEKYSDKEIFLLTLENNIVEPLTADNLEQWNPMILENHYVYQQTNEDGTVSVEVQQKEASLKPYTSAVLQIGVILIIALTFVNFMQRQYETQIKTHPP